MQEPVRPHLYALGYANVDVIANVSHLPRDGERVTSTLTEVHPGGMAANCACAAAQLGMPTDLVACIGRGGLAGVLLEDLEARGVGTAFLYRDDATTIALITVTPGGERAIVSEPVAYHASVLQAAITASVPGNRFVYTDGYHLRPAARELMAAHEAGCFTYCDLDGAPDTCSPADVEAVLRSIDVAQWNEAIVRRWFPDRTLEAAEAWLAARVGTVITTSGRGHVAIVRGANRVQLAVPEVREVVDTTGAGDIFAGAVLAGLGRGASLDAAVCAAMEVAAVSVRHRGARLPLGTTLPEMETDSISGASPVA